MDSSALSYRRPSALSASLTLSSVVQKTFLVPSAFTVSWRPNWTAISWPSVSLESGEGATTSCSPTVMSFAFSASWTVEPNVWTFCTCPSTETVTFLLFVAYPAVPPAATATAAVAPTAAMIDLRTSLPGRATRARG